jgi:hypothetical protein
VTSLHTASDHVQSAPDQAPARPSGLEPLTAWANRAGRAARQHRYELLILAGTVAFALLVGLLSLAALLG